MQRFRYNINHRHQLFIMVIELSGVQFWSEITRDFKIERARSASSI